ncbi:RNA polymerase sigma factor [Flavobacterium sp. RSB2_4_14]|uniref:RNA polymerase sigma factor n=1 Tax=Flavobacterium sp. RSB2_4_14 TaxID=3447665 RepID=UPI003F32D5F0
MENTNPKSVCDEIVFSHFFKDNVKSLRNYLYYKFGNEEKANDIAQDSFIKLWENCKNVPLEKAKSFLFTIATNASLNDIAHQKVVLKYTQNSTSDKINNENPEYLIEENQFKYKLEKAIDKLTEAQRVAFLLNRIEGKKYHEIAVMLNISVKAVEKRIHGALVTLRTEIEEFK